MDCDNNTDCATSTDGYSADSETASNCNGEIIEESPSGTMLRDTAARLENALRRSLQKNNKFKQDTRVSQNVVDIRTLPGYQPVPDECPQWKRAMIERKNQELLEKYKKELSEKRADEEKWRDVPEWKKALMMEKEKKRINETAPQEVERRRKEDELQRLQNMPEWKKTLLVKKKGIDVS